ncbi:YggT family protein [Bartonella sp. LJL80]
MIFALLQVVDLIFSIYIFILIASAIYSWLYAFNIVNPRNPLVAGIGNFLYRATEPVLAPIRRILPNLGAIDISPIVVFLIIYFLRIFMWRAYQGMFF